ncbi:MAG TPA: ABC transporter permease subunit [Candidatus Limnocylindria bacterium]|jgi:ABC-type transport system involved in multi-copper enzyme maturation permease subunit
MRALVIARLVIREAARRRLLLALLILTLIVMALTGWGFSRIPTITQRGVPLTDLQVKLLASQFLILTMFMFSFVLAMAAVFIAAPQISGDVESGTALAILSRPIARAEFVLGKWVGLAALVSVYAGSAAAIELGVVNAVVGYGPPEPLSFIAFVIAEGLVIMTLALLLSTRLSGMVGGVIALVLFGIAWIGGIVGGIGSAFDNPAITHVGTATKLILPTDGLWRGAVFALEPQAVLATGAQAGPAAAANPFYAAAAAPLSFELYVVGWVALVLALAVYSFHTREP